MLLFWTFYLSKNMYHGFLQNIKQHNCFLEYTDNNNNKYFLSGILEWFLKDHVTMKTGVMAAENRALPSQEYLFKKKNISQYYWFYCIFDQINAALVSIRDFQRHNILTPHFWTVVYITIFVGQNNDVLHNDSQLPFKCFYSTHVDPPLDCFQWTETFSSKDGGNVQ